MYSNYKEVIKERNGKKGKVRFYLFKTKGGPNHMTPNCWTEIYRRYLDLDGESRSTENKKKRTQMTTTITTTTTTNLIPKQNIDYNNNNNNSMNSSSNKLKETSSSKFELKLAELRYVWHCRYGNDYAFPDAYITFVNCEKGTLPPAPHHQIKKGDVVSTETNHTCDPK